MLLVEAAGEDEIKKLIIQIQRTLKESDEEAKSPYKISVSVGYARLDEKKSIKEVIDLADERQYEVKKVHHRIIEEESGHQPTES
jgi:GGDEF domain-containing protein